MTKIANSRLLIVTNCQRQAEFKQKGQNTTLKTLILSWQEFSSVETKQELVDWRSRCPISSALDVVGDKWSLLIIRDLFYFKTRTYSEFLESPERISTNILASRLALLASLNLIQRIDPQASIRNNAYQLTANGAALRPVLESLGYWAQAHLSEFHSQMLKGK